eukprot:757866-Ditylum_brightwellii.AAC.1
MTERKLRVGISHLKKSMTSKYKLFFVLIVLLSLKSVEHLRTSVSSLFHSKSASDEVIEQINNYELESSAAIPSDAGGLGNDLGVDLGDNIEGPAFEEVDIKVIKEINDLDEVIEIEMEEIENNDEFLYSNMGDISTTVTDENGNEVEISNEIVGNFDEVVYTDKEVEEESLTHNTDVADTHDMMDKSNVAPVYFPNIVDTERIDIKTYEYSPWRHPEKMDEFSL